MSSKEIEFFFKGSRAATKNELKVVNGEECSCGATPELVDSSEIYGKSYGPMYLCRLCRSYVGTHPNTGHKMSLKPLGRLADAELRSCKKEAHFYFDKIWKEKYKSREGAYNWLSNMLNVKKPFTHIGMFNVELCKKTAEISRKFLEENGR
jgi:hypothetical protein